MLWVLVCFFVLFGCGLWGLKVFFPRVLWVVLLKVIFYFGPYYLRPFGDYVFYFF